ncbi:hypothetical protein [Nocardia sp. NPDC048505]|uniref:hypothetical protein n=1 Tax=unclassified Nocardia TaxID=2637762 RepID=UPI0033C8B24F
MTERYGGLAPELQSGLDPEVADVLASWAELHNRYYTLERWLVNGRSRQPVAVVCEIDSHTTKATMLVLKVLSPQTGSLRTIEFARHRQAELEHSAFAAAHLSTFFHDAIAVPASNRWITFQRIAAQSLENTEVLTALLRRMIGLTDETESPATREISCTPGIFTDSCRSIVAGVLNEWAGPPFLRPQLEWHLAAFFERHLFDQLEPEGRLGSWARDHPTDLIRVEGEPEPLPNPFAVAQGRLLAEVRLAPLLGRSHGDLHTDNALIRVRPRIEAADYYLIDTALYESAGPLTRDPAHLLLYVIARSMATIAPHQQSALIELLLDPVGGPADLVPGWLAMLIRGLEAETGSWVAESGLAQRWREQNYLSLAACALLFLGRTSTRDTDKPWFLRLAARAVARFAAERGVPVDGSVAPAAEIPAPGTPLAAAPAPAPPASPPAGGSDNGRADRRKKAAKYDIRMKNARGVQIGENNQQFNIG